MRNCLGLLRKNGALTKDFTRNICAELQSDDSDDRVRESCSPEAEIIGHNEDTVKLKASKVEKY